MTAHAIDAAGGSLIAEADPANVAQHVAALWHNVPGLMNIMKFMAHAQTLVLPMVELGLATMTATTLQPRHRALASLLAASLEGGAYQWHHQLVFAQKLGLTGDELAALEAGAVTAPCFGESEQLVLRLTRGLVHGADVPPELVTQLAAAIGRQPLVELILIVSYQMTCLRVTKTLRVPLDADDPTPAMLAGLQKTLADAR